MCLSRFRPPPDPPPSPCKPPPLEARSPHIPPKPPDPPDVLLLASLQILDSSISSLVPAVAATHRSFFATTSDLTGSIFVTFGVQISTTWYKYRSTTWCMFQSSPTFQIEPWVLFAGTSLLFVKFSEGMDLIGIAGCLHDITNLATLFTPLSFKFYQCTTVCMAVAFAMYVFFKLCFSITLP
ncbi:uncharacterized protein LOC130500297 isoform X2 [Raphanus sativus]|uniref:Uncharacterized protein LOC130500297 isoform X2 n=1 Tax=Raphanus sativus TaxID=3726 RepID=A0A9W3CI11_RAPSA|nr:uncharacterized protein LOC130500297 isoform X2 [Raphanus sativus]